MFINATLHKISFVTNQHCYIHLTLLFYNCVLLELDESIELLYQRPLYRRRTENKDDIETRVHVRGSNFPYSEYYQLKRGLAEVGRYIDPVTADSNDFFRCISKQLFQEETSHALIRDLVSNYQIKHSTFFGTLIKELESRMKVVQGADVCKQIGENHARKIQDVFVGVDDVDIIATAMMLHQPIYVYSCGITGRLCCRMYSPFSTNDDDPISNQHPVVNSSFKLHWVMLLKNAGDHYDRVLDIDQAVPHVAEPKCTFRSQNTNTDPSTDGRYLVRIKG
jgi:hypothetical protein